ncbi:hypothetical protein [Streptoalloteichus tenebrarius]|uniref:hypothetical protein n=1 Tax=Streptoalloteichus tenebrarius (strain ATCC 17920 / DSM 40477 / JCM 4838 / CBS 697.72 / NBRC 16177 / NCIMB 11028 / NRRL B-12390 / A12253. 1 / ISP 5477) TaxID=1933 RepID=UPI0020A562E4|nr:hypothetical protein [Streptoalloteichus tenebrarius]BFF03164.1 hypothetical protein GCM10020241_48390 [Streptoalloteichus tenebrarius]
MPRSTRSASLAVVLTAAAVVLAGCGSSEDLAKVTYPRSTVPAAGAANTTGTTPNLPEGPVEPAFALDKLRAIDPCKLLDKEFLSQLGTPNEPTLGGYSKCSNYMKDKAGKKLSVSMTIGESLLGVKTNAEVAGLHAHVDGESIGKTCFVKAVTQGGKMPMGLTFQIGVDEGDACAPGRRIVEYVVERVRKQPPQRAAEPGTLATIEPCSLLDQAGRAEALGGETTERRNGLNECTWSASGMEVSVNLLLTSAGFGDTGDPVDVNGVKAKQRKKDTSVYPSCQIFWEHRKTAGNRAETVRVEMQNIKKANVDPCAKAIGAAKAMLPKLPKG